MTSLGPIIPIPEGKKGTNLKNWSTLSPAGLARIMANHRGNRGQRLDGIASLDPDSPAAVKLCEEWAAEGKLPKTWTYKTARGIIRRMYKRSADLTRPLTIKEINLQLRTGAGMYDVIPPSRVTDAEKGIDGSYEWLPGLDPESTELAELPQEILDYFKAHSGNGKAPLVSTVRLSKTDLLPPDETADGKYHAYAQKAVANELAILAGTPEKSRNDQLNKSAFALGQLVAAGILDRGPVEAALADVAASIGLTATEIQATIGSGIESGMREPRVLPERKEPEPPGGEVTAPEGGTGGSTQGGAPSQPDGRQKTPWQVAAHLFPRIPFPWEVLPGDIAESLQQLGRACATSPYALPGAAFCMVASIMGRTTVVSPKEGWEAPLIIWHLDIRDSGGGKTPPVRLMAGPIHEAQKEEEKRYEEEMEAYKRLSKKDQDQQPPPAPPRGYFVTDLTLEGLREDLVHSPHGGIVVIQDEISTFLSAQNQYKPKGSDREAWLALHDGHPARIRRVGRSLHINGARVSIFGGIQPKVFRKFFAGEDGLYLSDGTFFRFLATCEPSTFYDLTPESWGDRDRDTWEKLLHRAMNWVDGEVYARGAKIERPIRMILDSEAQGKFFKWRNQIYSFKDQLPAQLRGFLPKAVDYVLRLTGVIHCMQMFSIGRTPQIILSVEDLERGISTVQFYLGQIQDALLLIEQEDHAPAEVSERSMLLAQILDRLRPHLENGRLAIGFIQKQYNLIAPKTQRVGTPRGMGAVLRAVKLTTSQCTHNANGRRAVYCLEWNQQTETFIKQCLHQSETQEWRDIEGTDVEEPTSPDPVDGVQTLQTSENQCLHQETRVSTGQTDIADVADVGASTSEQFTPSPDWEEVPEGVAIPPGADVRMDMATGKNFARWPDGADTSGLNRSSGISDPEPGDIAGQNPGEPQDLVQCGWCQHFSSVQGGGPGRCRLYPQSSWNSKPFQSSDDLHPCPSFDPQDSIKILAPWDEAISWVVGEALNMDFQEVEI